MPFSAGKVKTEVQKETLLWIIYNTIQGFGVSKVFCFKKKNTFIQKERIKLIIDIKDFYIVTKVSI